VGVQGIRLAGAAALIGVLRLFNGFSGEPRVASTLQRRSDARDEALTKIRSALEKAGITFLPESLHGVGLRGRYKGP
jgi:hypothetical protein